MKILPNANELMRAAESALSNEERYHAYLVRKARHEALRARDAYLNKEIPPGSGQPDWWEYVDQDEDYIKQHSGENHEKD